MYLVDTSVWIHALRPRGNAAMQSQMRTLVIDGETAVTDWIILELMTGLARSEDGEHLLERFSPVARIPFRHEWWIKAWELAAGLRRQGISPSATDCMIATVAMESSVPLIHCDADFEAIRIHSKLQTLDWTIYL